MHLSAYTYTGEKEVLWVPLVTIDKKKEENLRKNKYNKDNKYNKHNKDNKDNKHNKNASSSPPNINDNIDNLLTTDLINEADFTHLLQLIWFDFLNNDVAYHKMCMEEVYSMFKRFYLSNYQSISICPIYI
jgi:hypothetical protein